MMVVNQFPDRTITIDNQEYLYFGGTAYLGLATHKKFQKIITSNIQKWGTSYGSSRNANIQLSAYDIAERYLANHVQADAAVTVSSGSLAGKLVIEQLTNNGVLFFHLPNHHNAIQSRESLPVWINNQLNPRLLDSKKEEVAILTDAVPTATIQTVDLSFIEMIHENKLISLVIDESHALGIIGENGCGLYAQISSKRIKNKIMVSSLGKGFGITGGVIAGNTAFINQLTQMSNFISAAGMNPAFAISIVEAKAIYVLQLGKLKSNLKYVKQNLKNDTIDFDVNYPILYPKNDNANELLKKNHIIITHFKYPNEKGHLNRIIITANHQKKDLKKLILILNSMS
jgi:7-keto-8-aminopelargonate synthetase-like enzyme